MSDTLPSPGNSSVSGAAAPVFPKLDAVRVHAALGNEMRLAMVKLLASDGRCMSVMMFTEHFKADYENVGKHCRVLLNAGVIGLRTGGDGRCRWYEIPPGVQTAPGVLDYGVCVVKFA
jgi:DNA-binding transcriptional ArsR family regulator